MGGIPSKWVDFWKSQLILLQGKSTCLSGQRSALIIEDRQVISYGYNGAPRGVDECTTTGVCFRQGYPSGEALDMCIATHAEVNAIANAASLGISTKGCMIICSHQPCLNCLKTIVNAKIKSVFYVEGYSIPESQRVQYDMISSRLTPQKMR